MQSREPMNVTTKIDNGIAGGKERMHGWSIETKGKRIDRLSSLWMNQIFRFKIKF